MRSRTAPSEPALMSPTRSSKGETPVRALLAYVHRHGTDLIVSAIITSGEQSAAADRHHPRIW